MTYTIVQTTEMYDRNGDVRDTHLLPMERHDTIEAAFGRVWEMEPKMGYLLELTDRKCVKLGVFNEAGDQVYFSDAYRIIEGQQAYDDVMAGRAPGLDSKSYFAALK